MGTAINHKAWIAKAPKQPMVLETVDLGPLGAEDVEVAVEHCGLCHSDLSVFNNDWGFSQYPAILGHEVVGRVAAMGPNAKGLKIGQRVGVGWNSGRCTHCHQRSSRIRQGQLSHRAGRRLLILAASSAGRIRSQLRVRRGMFGGIPKQD